MKHSNIVVNWSNTTEFVYSMLTLEQDEYLMHLRIRFYNLKDNNSGEFSILMAPDANKGEIEDAIVDEYSNGRYEPIDEDTVEMLLEAEAQNIK